MVWSHEATLGVESNRVQRSARRVEHANWFRRVAQAGLVARAVIYLLLGVLAIEVATKGSSSAQPDSQGALTAVARQPSGPFLVSLLAAGFAAYAVWRLVQAVAGATLPEKSEVAVRIGRVAIALFYLGLCAEGVDILVRSSSNGAANNPEPFVTDVLRWTGGPEIIGLFAVCLAGGGVALGIWGVAHDYAKVIDAGRLGRAFTPARVAGAVGDCARGLLVVLVAVDLLSTAITDDPRRAKGLGNAIQSLAGKPGGPELLGFVAVGLFAFAGYSIVEAVYRRTEG